MTKTITDIHVVVDQDSDIVDEKLIVDGKYMTPVHVIREID